MHEQLAQYAKRYSETDLEILLKGGLEVTHKIASNIAIYEDKVPVEEAKAQIENADLMSAVLACIQEEGFIAEINGEHLVVAQSSKFEEKLANKVWVGDHVGQELVRQAKKAKEKMVKIQRVPSKFAKPAEELGWGTPGYTYCSVWRIPATHTIEIGGYVVPAYMVGYTQKIMPRSTQWGTKENENKQIVPDRAKISKLESVNRILTAMESSARLVQKENPKTGEKEWALVSTDDSAKTLRYFGPDKPSNEAVEKEEKRVNYFKHNAHYLGSEKSVKTFIEIDGNEKDVEVFFDYTPAEKETGTGEQLVINRVIDVATGDKLDLNEAQIDALKEKAFESLENGKE